MRTEIERRVMVALDERAGKGLLANSLDSLKAFMRTDMRKRLATKPQAAPRPNVLLARKAL